MDIRLVALDLDGTTMNSDNRLSDYNRKTLEAAVLYAVGMYVIDMPQMWLRLPLRTLLIAAFVVVVIRHEGIRLPKRLHL